MPNPGAREPEEDRLPNSNEFKELIEFKRREERSELSPSERSQTYADRVRRFRKGRSDVRVAIFAQSGIGAYITPERVTFAIFERCIEFDWIDAQRLIHRADRIGNQACDMWPFADDANRSRLGISQSTEAERKRLLDRVFQLISSLLSAVNQENQRHASGPAGWKRVRRFLSGRGRQASDTHLKKLLSIESDVADAERDLQIAAERSAQERYAEGMLRGLFALGTLTGMLAIVFAVFSVPAYTAVAFPAGGLGATVSVLQRMSKGNLELDYNARFAVLTMYGAIRPFVGAIFGMAAFVFVEGGLTSVITLSHAQQLPFFTAIGFLAGFNERFAQDMLVDAGRQIASPGTARL